MRSLMVMSRGPQGGSYVRFLREVLSSELGVSPRIGGVSNNMPALA